VRKKTSAPSREAASEALMVKVMPDTVVRGELPNPEDSLHFARWHDRAERDLLVLFLHLTSRRLVRARDRPQTLKRR
jgi:hypothetical protein